MNRVACLVALLGATGCVATDVGNPQTTEEATAEVRLEAYVEEVPNALMLDDGVELTHVWLSSDRVELEPCDSEEEEELDEVEDEDLVVTTDLLTGASFPGPLLVTTPGARFCGFRLDVRPLDSSELPEGAPADLADASVLVRGTRKDGNPFIMRGTFTESFELDGDIDLRLDAVNHLVVGFAVNGWISHRAIAALEGNPITIDESNNTPIYEAFEDAVKDSARLFDGQIAGEPLAR